MVVPSWPYAKRPHPVLLYQQTFDQWTWCKNTSGDLSGQNMNYLHKMIIRFACTSPLFYALRLKTTGVSVMLCEFHEKRDEFCAAKLYFHFHFEFDWICSVAELIDFSFYPRKLTFY